MNYYYTGETVSLFFEAKNRQGESVDLSTHDISAVLTGGSGRVPGVIERTGVSTFRVDLASADTRRLGVGVVTVVVTLTAPGVLQKEAFKPFAIKDALQQCGCVPTTERPTPCGVLRITVDNTIVDGTGGAGLVLSQWKADKQAIAEAITLQGVPTEPTDPGTEMAQKIRDFQLAVPDDPAAYIAPIAFSDLFTVCHNNQRAGYRGMYAVRCSLVSDIVLVGADAYLTSDGAFYTGDTTHVWDDTVLDRWVIYFSENGNLSIQFPASYTGIVNEVAVYSGKIIALAFGAVLTNFLVSDNVERYSINASGSTLLLGMVTLYSYIDMAVEELGSFWSANTALRVLALPSLKRFTGGNRFIYNSSIALTQLRLDNLEEITCTTSFLETVSTLRSVILQKLKLATTTVINNCRAVDKVDLPALEKSSTVVTANDALETLSLPALKESTATIVISCSKLKTLDLSGLETSVSIANNCAELEQVYTTALKSTTYGTFFLFTSCPKIKEVNISSLSALGCGVADNMQDLTSIVLEGLTNWGTVNTGICANNCPVLKEVRFPALRNFTMSVTSSAYTAFRNCPELEVVDLGQVEQISSALAFNCPKLKYVFLPATDNATLTASVSPLFLQYSNIETLELGEGFRKSIDLRYWATFKDAQTVIDYVFNRIADTGRAMTLTISTAIRDAVTAEVITELVNRTGITVTVV